MAGRGSSPYAFLFKYIIIGDTGVGKSCLLLQFTDKRFQPVHDLTIGVEFGARMVNIDQKQIKLQIWDTAGQEAFAPIIKTYFRGSAGALLCFSLSEIHAMDRITHWHKELKTHVPEYSKFVLIGTKFDEGPICEIEEITDYATEHNMDYVFCSALTSYRCNEILYTLSRKIYEDKHFDKTKSKVGIKVMNLSTTEEEKMTDEMVELYCTKCVIN